MSRQDILLIYLSRKRNINTAPLLYIYSLLATTEATMQLCVVQSLPRKTWKHPTPKLLSTGRSVCVLFNSLLVRRAWPQLGAVIPAGVQGRAFRAEVLHFRYCATEKPLSSKLFHLNLFIYLYLYRSISMQVYLGADLYSCTCAPTPALRGGVFWAASHRSHKVGKWPLSHALRSDWIPRCAQTTLNAWLWWGTRVLRLL